MVLFRSYTGAQVRYYIDRATGDVHVTEFVPGITPEGMPSEESLNVWITWADSAAADKESIRQINEVS